MIPFLGTVLFALMIWLLPGYWRRWRRRRLRAKGLSPQREQLLSECLPLYRRLPPDLQAELRANISLFLHRKEFVGCNGLQVTEPMRMTVAALACLLLLRRENDCYPHLHTLLLYPDTYIARETHFDGPVATQLASTREGESWYRGPVVLSWADLQQDMQHPEQGRNLVLHEFAHKLDEEDGLYNGRPVFSAAGDGQNWANVMSREFEALRDQSREQPPMQPEVEDCEIAALQNSVLDFYGAESPAEFFAVATEAFFVTPREMQARHEELYREFCNFYRVDPASWLHENPPAYQYPEK